MPNPDTITITPLRPRHADPSPTGAPFVPKPAPRPAPLVPALGEAACSFVPPHKTAAVRWFWRDEKFWSPVEYKHGGRDGLSFHHPRGALYSEVRMGPSEVGGTLTVPPKGGARGRGR